MEKVNIFYENLTTFCHIYLGVKRMFQPFITQALINVWP